MLVPVATASSKIASHKVPADYVCKQKRNQMYSKIYILILYVREREPYPSSNLKLPPAFKTLGKSCAAIQSTIRDDHGFVFESYL